MTSDKTQNTIRFLILILAIILLVFLGRYFKVDLEAVQNALRKFPLFLSGTIFVLLYVVVTFFVWLSKDIFRLASAILFGAYISTLFVFIAETINAFILFYFARYLGRSFVENSLKGKYKTLDEKLGKISFSWLFLFRAVPLIPFRFLDLASGLTKISFKKYLTAVLLGSPLRIFWLQFTLAGVGEAVFKDPYALAEFLLKNRALLLFTFVYLILIIVVAFKIRRKE